LGLYRYWVEATYNSDVAYSFKKRGSDGRYHVRRWPLFSNEPCLVPIRNRDRSTCNEPRHKERLIAHQRRLARPKPNQTAKDAP